jgi:Icc protein
LVTPATLETARFIVFFGMVLSFNGHPGGPLQASPSSSAHTDAPKLLIQLTDLHLMQEPEREMCHVNTDASLRAVIELVGEHGHRPDLVLATGDLSQDGSAPAYERLRHVLSQTNWPVRCLPGNHDDPRVMREVLGPWTDPVVDIGAWRIVMLDSTIPGSNAGHLSDDQLDLLDAAARDEGRHVLVALHHNPIQVASGYTDTMMLENAPTLFQRLAELPRTRVLLWGHVHHALDRRRLHLRLLATPSTCFQFGIRDGKHVIDPSPPGYRWLKLYQDGSFATGIRRIGEAAWREVQTASQVA